LEHFIEEDSRGELYGNHATTDIESAIRRSETDYELKQGLLSLSDQREIDPHIIDKVVRTICAIANNGPNRMGKFIIGVTDKAPDVGRIEKLDGIEPKRVGKRFVVGVAREAKVLHITMEKYLSKWKDGIKNSQLSQHLKDCVMSNIDFNSFYGLGVIVITIPSQKELSYVGDELFWRNGDSTERVETPKQIAALAQRF
jgi:predicted HTH transcriptional regulator